MNFLLWCVVMFANVNNVAAVLYLLYVPMAESYRTVCWAALLSQPTVYYLMYLHAAWVSLKEVLPFSSPDALLTETISMAGLLPAYIVLGTVKLLHTHTAFIYVAPQRHSMSRLQWLRESTVLPVATQGFLQCVPCLAVAFLNGIDPENPVHLLFSWSSLSMATLAALAVCGFLGVRRRHAD